MHGLDPSIVPHLLSMARATTESLAFVFLNTAGRTLGLIVLLVGIQMGLDLFVRPNDIFMIAPGIAD